MFLIDNYFNIKIAEIRIEITEAMW